MAMRKKRWILAVRGGRPVLARPLPEVHNYGAEEVAAVSKVLRRGPLSGFLGVSGEKFFGGPEVLAFEAAFARKFKVKHAVAFNSATTALHGALVALEIGPGDEVIVPPYTMSASVAAILANGAVPIFADIDSRTFCIDPRSVRERITKYTKAVMVVNLFGQAADLGELLKIREEHRIALIEDNAQSPGATWRGKYTGTIGDVGVFSLNVHKTMQTGEGGVLVTNNDRAALRAQLCRNHGESVADDLNTDVGPIFGSNYRMTEFTAAMARIQLKKLDMLTKKRVALAERLTRAFAKIPGLEGAHVHPDNTHVYYRYAIKVDEKVLGMPRDTLVEAMYAEGFPMSRGYQIPIYLLSIFQNKRAFNATNFPFSSNYYDGNPDYSKGICPVTERLYEKEFTLTDVCQYPHTNVHVDLFVKALTKVIAHKDELA